VCIEIQILQSLAAGKVENVSALANLKPIEEFGSAEHED